MDKREEIEDEAFRKKWLMAEKGVDYFQMAHVLSGRLRQMEKRARSANKRADEAEFALSQARSQAYDDITQIIEAQHKEAWGCTEEQSALERAIQAIREAASNPHSEKVE